MITAKKFYCRYIIYVLHDEDYYFKYFDSTDLITLAKYIIF